MSIPYPSDFNIDHAAAHQEERRRRALKSLDPSDVLAAIDDLISQESASEKHPCFSLVNWLLDRAMTLGHGGEFWDQWKTLALQAIDQLVEAHLQAED